MLIPTQNASPLLSYGLDGAVSISASLEHMMQAAEERVAYDQSIRGRSSEQFNASNASLALLFPEPPLTVSSKSRSDQTPLLSSTLSLPPSPPKKSLSQDTMDGEPPLSPPCAEPHASSSCDLSSSQTQLRKRKKRTGKRSDEQKQCDRKAKRERESEKKTTALSRSFYNPPSEYARTKYPTPTDAVPTCLNPAKDSPVQSTGFQANSIKHGRRRLYSLEELKADGYTLLEWNGIDNLPVLDAHQRIIAVLCGRITSCDFEIWHKAAVGAFATARDKLEPTRESESNRRGSFKSIWSGITRGYSKEPLVLRQSAHNQNVLDELMSNPAVVRMAGWQGTCMSLFAPKLYKHYAETMNSLVLRHPHLQRGRNFKTSVFPAATFNLGPQTVTLEHLDSSNLSYGWCPITALGNYDPRTGGHLVLADLKLVIEFPPGSTALIPSSILRHGNTPIQSHETRMSFTQYASGGLFRWVQSGFCSQSGLSKEVKQDMLDKAPSRFENGLELFSVVTNLANDRTFL